MKVITTPLDGLCVIGTESFGDNRGKFARFFCQEELDQVYQDRSIKQVNYSMTISKGTIRGMHFQNPPKAETKLVRCTQGSIFDIAVDLRKGSETFLQWYGAELSSENMKMLFIPEGFAHGFQALEDNCEMLYLHSESYSQAHEGGLRYDDPEIGIEWPLEVSVVSDRDTKHPLLKNDFEGIVL
ncbi:dTDP-4-dehydrorhamnose 3,5-epimerase [Planctomycetota bacterium]